jgi:hypothetical protein
MPLSGDWEQSREHVARELERLASGQHKHNNDVNRINLQLTADLHKIKDELKDGQNEVKEELGEKLTSIRVDIGMLKVKAGVWGALGGAIIAVGMLLWFLIKR